MNTKPNTSIGLFLSGKGGGTALKMPRIVYAERVSSEVSVSTREGTVLALPGDYVLSDADGNQWPISEEHLNSHYDVIEQNGSGRLKLRGKSVTVHAIQLSETVSIPIRADGSMLRGAPGDWLIRYSSGEFGIVAKHLFFDSYRLLE